ncbi:hypothetical protein [Nonomuraea lactucae]|uniref:hypothetical protein n=1 Tax=Nonomuraea lactucae TaxID=2249762 RepID=UPI0013B44120|nr:hypothetical protein [Nonomuraea lactucae]
MDWNSISELMGCDDPAEVDAAFARGGPLTGVALIGLALNVLDPALVAPRLHRAMTDDAPEIRRCGALSVGHMARLNKTVDDKSPILLRQLLEDPAPIVRGTASDALSDIWIFVRRTELPCWLHRRALLALVRGKVQLLCSLLAQVRRSES